MLNGQTQLFSHIFLVLKVGVLGLFKKIDYDTSLPLRRKDLRLHKILKNFPCGVGIYEDGNGQKVLMKVWRGPVQTYAYHQLIKEIRLYELLHRVIERIGPGLDGKFRNVRIPRILEKEITPTTITATFEYIDGCIHLKDVPSFSEKSRIHDLAVDFWTYVGNHLTAEEKLQIPRRTLADTLIIYLIVLGYAVFRYPKQIPALARTVPIVLKALPSLFRNWREGLIHRDFHFENILVNNENIAIIDFGDNAITHPLQVFANSLHWEWDNRESKKVILQSISSAYGKSPETDNIFRALFAISTVQLLHDTESRERLELNFRCFNSVVYKWGDISEVLTGNI